jgi:ubiquinone/menaquinone biosynthesis C-methylase UbiE
MHDPNDIFEPLGLTEGDSFLDLACGAGDYAVEALKHVGSTGTVYAVDRSENAIASLRVRSEKEGLTNLSALLMDLTEPLPFADFSVDVCLLSMVLHMYCIDRIGPLLFPEIHRLLKPGGRLAILECTPGRTGYGPPERNRISPATVITLASEHGFEWSSLTDLGRSYIAVLTAQTRET